MDQSHAQAQLFAQLDSPNVGDGQELGTATFVGIVSAYDSVPLAESIKASLSEIARSFIDEGRTNFDDLVNEFEELLGGELFDAFAAYLPEIFDLEEKRTNGQRELDAKKTQRSLDELFNLARRYRTGSDYRQLMDFVAHFRFYSPYNALLINVQMQGARFVAPAHRWVKEFGRSIKATARPLVILQPMGPVMFVFDVSDTEPGPHAKLLPTGVDKPFEVGKGAVGKPLERTIENAVRDGVRTLVRHEGSQSAGSIRGASDHKPLRFLAHWDRKSTPIVPIYIDVPVRYDLLINATLSDSAQYATLVHELAHLYCGHLGTPNAKWWPNRQRLKLEVREFEAESVAYLICGRLGIDNPSGEYLSGYLGDKDPPDISLECVMKAAGLIEQMGRQHLKQRKPSE